MGYVEEFLTDNEKIICNETQKTNPSIVVLFLIGGGSLLFFLIIGASKGTEAVMGGLMLGLLISLPCLLSGFAKLQKQKTTEIVLTDKRIIYKYGSLNIRLTEIYLNQIEGITLQEAKGTLIIRGTGTGLVKIPLLENPSKFRKKISEAQSLK